MDEDLLNRIQDRIGKLNEEEKENISLAYYLNDTIKKVIDGLMREGGHFEKVKEG